MQAGNSRRGYVVRQWNCFNCEGVRGRVMKGMLNNCVQAAGEKGFGARDSFGVRVR